MSRKRSAWIHLAILLVWGSQLQAQTNWPLQHVNKRSGLSNSAVNTIYMDHRDYVWFGTWDGLNRYDGEEIVSFKPIAKDSTSISNNIIRQILEDKEQNLWVITYNGINRYDRKLNLFHRYFNDLKGIPFLENNLKATLSEDSTLYISLIGWGVGKYDQVKDEFIPVMLSQTSKSIHNLGVHQGVVYAIDDKGNLSTTAGSKNPIKLEWSPNVFFQRFVTMNNRLYYIYQFHPDKLEIKELEKGAIINAYSVSTNQSMITALGKSENGQEIFLGTSDGQLLKFEVADHQITRNLNSNILAIFNRKLKIFSIFESRQGILWIGTDGDGVYKYLTKDRAFMPVEEGVNGGKLSNSIIRAIYLNKNTLYAGTRSGGLNILRNLSTQTIDKTNGLSDNTVLSIAPDHSGNIWLGLDNEGIDMIESETGKVLHFPEDFTNTPEELYFGSVYKIFIDAYGHLWLGTSGYGVVFLAIEKKQPGTYELKEFYSITPEKQFGDIYSFKSNIVYAITSEEPNILWFGTRNGGLYRYNSLSRKFTHFLGEGENNRYALNNNDILSLYLNKRNELWVGTSGGLNKVNLNDYTVQQYSQSEGLANNTIHAIMEDYTGRLWLSSNNGLFAFTPTTNNFKNFNWTDGLLNDEYTDGAYYQDYKNNLLYFGGTKGIDIVDPFRIDTTITFPRLAITDFLINNIPVEPGDSSTILQKNIDFQSAIQLNYDQNFLTLRFTTLDYWHKHRCEYRYQLAGFDDRWIEIGKQSNINLTNIPPGDYKLLLNNSNENGDWNPEIRALDITINPPFWRTRWAYVFYTLLIILAQLGLIQYLRNRAKRKKAREIELLKKEQAETIQKYKLEFFTDITHEFRTPLTLILGPAVKLLEKTKDNNELNSSAHSIYRNSLRLQKLIQELIQFRKVEMGKEQLRIRRINVVAFTDELLQNFRQYAQEKEITLTYESPDTLQAQIDSDILEKILINLISNALKYTEKFGKVDVKIWSEGHKVLFSVRDNGHGIPENEVNRIFERFSNIHHEKDEPSSNSAGIGLSLTKKLINLHQGEIHVSSETNEGTQFTFWLPDNLPLQEQLEQDPVDRAVVNNLNEHVRAEFYHKDNLEKELINISLERFEHNVLIIDDNEQILRLLKDILSPLYNVTSCSRAKEALDILESKMVDLVVSDVIMPEMSGYELCNVIKTKIETSHIPVILLTAKGELEERIEGLKSGADAYIPKPFHPDHLKIRVEKLIGTRELLKKKFEAFNTETDEFSSFGIGEKDDAFFRAIDQFIKTEICNPELDATHLANHIGMSKTSLYKKVRALTGQSPHALFNQYRLKQAAYLLIHSDLNVSEIIYKVGFNSRSYFYKSFQEMFQCSPSAYPNSK